MPLEKTFEKENHVAAHAFSVEPYLHATNIILSVHLYIYNMVSDLFTAYFPLLLLKVKRGDFTMNHQRQPRL